jgi:hypothetical protein
LGCVSYRELDESEGEHGPEASEVGVGEEAAEEGEQEDGANEVGDHVGCLRQREVHLPEHVGDEVVPHRRERHDLERLGPYTSSKNQRSVSRLASSAKLHKRNAPMRT